MNSSTRTFDDANNELSSWNLQKGYSSNNSTSYPHRVLGTGTAAGLEIVLKIPEIDVDYVCRGRLQSFKVTLHTPGDIPNMSKNYFRVPLRKEVVVSVKPNMFTTSKGLANDSPEMRQCFYENEGNLQFFKVYTQANCELECLTNFTLREDYFLCTC